LNLLGFAAAALGATSALAAPATGNSEQRDKVVCRRVIPTGSIAVEEKICRTEARWRRLGEDDREERERALNFGGLPRSGQALQVGSARWETMPTLRERPADLPYRRLVSMVEEMLQAERCALPGQSARSFDIEVPFAVLVGPDGAASRVVVSQMSCTPLEEMVGLIALARAERGDFRPSAAAEPRWYRGRINFTLRD
jgi:hypothetical protein